MPGNILCLVMQGIHAQGHYSKNTRKQNHIPRGNNDVDGGDIQGAAGNGQTILQNIVALMPAASRL